MGPDNAVSAAEAGCHALLKQPDLSATLPGSIDIGQAGSSLLARRRGKWKRHIEQCWKTLKLVPVPWEI